MNKKTVLITGASRGIGKAVAIRFAEEGYNLILSCKENSRLLSELKARLIENYSISCLDFTGNMGDMDTVALLFEQIKSRYGSVDILINNAGISYIGLLTDMTANDWNEILTTNLTSVFNCCKLAVPGMVHKKEGKIINISSVWGNYGASCEVAYSATKGGINAFTRALAKELAPSNIQVNAIACGVIDTEMNRFLSPEEKKQLLDEIPSGRMGAPKEVADFVYDIASGHNYLTGQIIQLDGGWM
jgi:3-oxoacyl-[acyl-carrier protein] reductase